MYVIYIELRNSQSQMSLKLLLSVGCLEKIQIKRTVTGQLVAC